MLQFPTFLTCDAYKTSHIKMSQPGQTLMYSALVPRKSRIEGINNVVFFGLQYFIKDYLISGFNETFFKRNKEEVLNELETFYNQYFGPGQVDLKKIADLHDLGYLPLRIKALPEGGSSPIGTPLLTIVNTHDDFPWLTNYIETALQSYLWHPITVASKTKLLRATLDKWAAKTSDRPDFVDFQAHTFSMRGCSGIESATTVDAAHLVYFKGSDTLTGNLFCQKYYDADPNKGVISWSCAASEHSCMTGLGQEGEFDIFKRLVTETFPNGIISVVSDSFDFTEVINPDNGFLVKLKQEILNRDGVLTIRPDSSRKTPLEIICGDPDPHPDYNERQRKVMQKGLVVCLDEIFGHTVNSKGYKDLNSKISYIYGECISQPLLENICATLANMGYSSTNGVYGIGSWEHIGGLTRDSFGLAQKALYAEFQVEGAHGKGTKGVNIFKNPITDSGEKKSHKGLIRVNEDYSVTEECSWKEEGEGLLKTVFENGFLLRPITFAEVRENAK